MRDPNPTIRQPAASRRIQEEPSAEEPVAGVFDAEADRTWLVSGTALLALGGTLALTAAARR